MSSISRWRKSGVTHVHGNCTIALRLTRGYWKSSDDREWRRELASCPSPAGRHPPLIFTSKMTPLSAVWLCPWWALQTCLDSVGFSWFCMYHCLSSAARMDRLAAVLSTRIARWCWVSSAYWQHRTPLDAMTSATGLQRCESSVQRNFDFWWSADTT